MDLITQWLNPSQWNATAGIEGLLLVLALFVVGNLAVIFLLIRLPADYFCISEATSHTPRRHPILHWAILVFKNVFGLLLAVLGVVLSLPGVPGPGLLLILIGITLLDFPGKRRLERKIVSRPRVLRTVNSLRKRFGALPFDLDGRRDERAQE